MGFSRMCGEEARTITRKAGYRARRWIVKRMHSGMHRFRRLLMRWEKRPENTIGLLHGVCGIITFRFAGLYGKALKIILTKFLQMLGRLFKSLTRLASFFCGAMHNALLL
jgi:hypothetical protein